MIGKIQAKPQIKASRMVFDMGEMVEIDFIQNGKPVRDRVPGEKLLLWYLRKKLNLLVRKMDPPGGIVEQALW